MKRIKDSGKKVYVRMKKRGNKRKVDKKGRTKKQEERKQKRKRRRRRFLKHSVTKIM